MSKFIAIAFRNIFRNKRRSLLSIIAIAVAVFFIIIMIGFIDGMLESMGEIVQTFETGHISLYDKDFENKQEFFPLQYPLNTNDIKIKDFIEKIEKMDGVKAVLPRITSFATLTDNLVKNALLMGIDFKKENKTLVFNMLYKLSEKKNGLVSGRFPEKKENGEFKNECIIGHTLAKKMNIKIGDKIPLKIISSQYSDKFYKPAVVGFFDYNYDLYNSNYIIIPFEKMQKLASLAGKTQKLLIYLSNQRYVDTLYKQVQELINQDTIIKKWSQHSFIAMMDSFTLLYYVIYGVFIAVASFLIINTVIMVIHERIKEIGMMGALGMQKEEIMLVFFLEALMLSMIGSFFGTALGALFTLFFSFYPLNVLKLTGGLEMPMGNIIYFKFAFDYLLIGFFFGIIVSGVCTIFPSLKSAFIKPVEALRR